jgi:hypothetical protein
MGKAGGMGAPKRWLWAGAKAQFWGWATGLLGMGWIQQLVVMHGCEGGSMGMQTCVQSCVATRKKMGAGRGGPLGGGGGAWLIHTGGSMCAWSTVWNWTSFVLTYEQASCRIQAGLLQRLCYESPWARQNGGCCCWWDLQASALC